MKLSKVLITISLICFGGLAHSAQERGNGTDDYNKKSYAWFNQASNGSYCVHKSNDFPVSQQVAEAGVRNAISKWQSYIANHASLKNDVSVSKLQFNFHARCNGSEILRFELGTSLKFVKKSLESETASIAFPVLESFDKASKSGRGYIWIAGPKITPKYINWSAPNVLASVIIHEIGHILGCEHVPMTIMDQDLSKLIADANSSRDTSFLTDIDLQRELVMEDFDRSFIPTRNCSNEVIESFTFATADVAPNGFTAAWKLLLGRDPLINANTRIRLTNYCTEIVFTDQLGSASFPLALFEPLGTMPLGIEIFKPYLPPSGLWSPTVNLGYEKLGEIRAFSNAPATIDFRRNLESSAHVDVVSGGHLLPLFRARNSYEINKGSL